MPDGGPAGIDRDERRPLARRLVAPSLATIVLQAVLVAGDRMPSIDAMAYFEAGASVLDGHGFRRQGAPEVHFPPVAPVAYGLLERLTGDQMQALRLWNLVWGLAFVALLTAIGWWISRDHDVTVATAWLATTVGGGVCLAIRGGSGSELATVCLLLAAALVALAAFDRPSGRPLPHQVGALAAMGLLVGTAYATRPEAIYPGVTLGILAIVRAATTARPQRRWPTAGAALGAFAVTAALIVGPYASYVHHNTGTWALTPKSRDASIEAWRSIAKGDRLQRDTVLYAIADDGITLGPKTQPLASLARQHPAEWAGIVAVNTTNVARYYLLWQILPLFLLVPGLGRIWSTRRRWSTVVLASVAAWPLVTCTLYFTLPRYLIATTAVLVPFGVWGLTDWIARSQPARRRWLWGAVGALSVVSLAVAAWPLLPGSSAAEHTEPRTAGRWLAAHTAPDARIMTRSYHVQEYADRPVVAMPYASYPEVLAYARRMGVSYLVADDASIRGRRPELVATLLRPDRVPRGLVVAHRFTERGRTVTIYRLDPPAPPSPHPPRPLGYVGD